MGVLNDLIVKGASRFIGDIYSNNIESNSIESNSITTSTLYLYGNKTSNKTNRYLYSDTLDNMYFKINDTIPLVIRPEAIGPALSLSGTINLGATDRLWKDTYSKTFRTYDSANTSGTDHGFLVNDTSGAKYAAMYFHTAGTTSTVGIGALSLGNASASGTTKNARGAIFIYGTNTSYTRLMSNLNATSSSTIYLPNKTGDSYLIHASSTAVVGSATKPVYIEADGRVTAMSYTIEKSVPSDAVFTDTKVTQGVTTATSWRKVLLNAATNTSGADVPTEHTSKVYSAIGVEVYPSDGTLQATHLKSNGNMTIDRTDYSYTTATRGTAIALLGIKYNNAGTGVYSKNILSAIATSETTATVDQCSIILTSGGGSLVLGSGESAPTVQKNNNLNTNENMYLIADGTIHFYTNANTAANARKMLEIGNSSIVLTASSRYSVDIVGKNNEGSSVSEIYYDAGSTTAISSGRWYFRGYSPNTTASTTSTGKYEAFALPTVSSGVTANVTYCIPSSKGGTADYVLKSAGATAQPVWVAQSALSGVAAAKTTSLSFGATATIATIGGNDIKVTMPANPNTDTKVTMTSSTNNADVPVILAAGASPTSGSAYGSLYSTKVKVNPSTGNLIATQLNGVTIGSSPKFTDTNTWTALSTSTAGYVAAAPNDTTKFLRGDASWAALPSASTTVAGIVTTANQSFEGRKTFKLINPTIYDGTGGSSRHRYIYFNNNVGNLAYMRFDAGHATNFTASQFGFLQYSPPTTTATTPYINSSGTKTYEMYYLPAATKNLAANKSYYIFAGTYSTTDLTAGTSELKTGTFYAVYV